MANKSASVDIASQYKWMLVSVNNPWCWWCGRGLEHQPASWSAPWIIERAHIVNNPRREDRRAVVLLCSMCHRVQHGEQLVLPGMTQIVRPGLAQLIWMKRNRDPEFFCREFLQANHIGRLPSARAPHKTVLSMYQQRRGNA